ncbi:MAG: hypothetical protein NVV59_13365 [Chitinophagaceae bacterium]|nr:hypothetical protein [Chitinophagaceae bacterium]
MKRYLKFLSMIAALWMLGSGMNKVSAQPGGVSITYQDFYDGLSPHGEWMDYPEYGYVWRPTGINEFQPYSSGGRWVWTDQYDWMWVSDYDWGWAPFHYGRWFHDPFYGWMWVPGYEWAPAWVAWRDGGDYYGWAPLRPGIHIGVNFNFGTYNPPIDYWCFAPRRYITSASIWNYTVPRRQNVTIINNTTIINNYGRRGGNVFVTGPRRAEVERYTGRIRPVQFRESGTAGRSQISRNQVSVYRPEIRRDNDRTYTPRQFNRYEGNNNANAGRNNRAAGNRNENVVRRDNERPNQPRVERDNRATGNRNQPVIQRDNERPNQPRAERDNRAAGNRNQSATQRNNERANQARPERSTRVNNEGAQQPGRNPQIEQRVRADRNIRENRIERAPARPQTERRVTAPQQQQQQRATQQRAQPQQQRSVQPRPQQQQQRAIQQRPQQQQPRAAQPRPQQQREGRRG